MKAEEFRRIALSLPEAVESAHVGHPDFRVWGKIFATLGYPTKDYGVVMLQPEQQREFVQAAPAAFAIVNGAWGRRGSTQVLLKAVQVETLRNAITIAWRKAAPPKLAKEQAKE